MRRNPPEPEKRMWRILHPFRQAGMHWRRQVPIGPYIVDFASHSPSVVIEVDGDTHGTDTGIRRDVARDSYLTERGYEVIRFTNRDVMENREGVYAVLAEKFGSGAPPPLTPPRKGEGDMETVRDDR